MPALQASLVFLLLCIAAAWDILRREIPNTVSLLIATAGLICLSPAQLWGILVALPFLLAALRKEGSIGGGDIKLVAALGFSLGFFPALWAMVLGLACLLLFHAGQILFRRLRRRNRRKPIPQALPLAPFLTLGYLLAYFTI